MKTLAGSLVFSIVMMCGSACTQKAAEATKAGANTAVAATVDTAKAAGDKIAEVSKDAAKKTAEVIDDGWITTKVSARFVDEILLKGSAINVDTTNHVVTLTGTVKSGPARKRAGEVATGTQGVTRVVNQLVVK